MAKTRKIKEWKVYVHTNKTNGKTYVGITKMNVNERWMNGLGYKSQPFYKAIEKYGWDGFRHEIVAEKLSEEEAKTLERNLIIILKSKMDEHGYNLSEGGDCCGVSHTSVYQFDYNGNLVNKYESCTDAGIYTNCKAFLIRYALKKSHHQYNGFIWRRANECDDLNKIKKEIVNNPRTQYLYPIYQFDYEGNFIKEYLNAYEVGKDFGVRPSAIIFCCRDKEVHALGYCWKFKKDVPDITAFKPRSFLTNKTKHNEVVQLDLDGNYIATFPSVSEASRQLGLCDTAIRNVCLKKKSKHTCGGYKWVRLKDYKFNIKDKKT